VSYPLDIVASVTRRRFVQTAATLVLGLGTAGVARGGARVTPTITVHKSPT
jgi:hypothetical protein